MRDNPPEVQQHLSSTKTGALYCNGVTEAQVATWYDRFRDKAESDFGWGETPLPWTQLHTLLGHHLFLWASREGFVLYVPHSPTHLEWLVLYAPVDIKAMVSRLQSAQSWLDQINQGCGTRYTSLQWCIGPLNNPHVWYAPRLGLQLSTQVQLELDLTNPSQAACSSKILEHMPSLPENMTFRWVVNPEHAHPIHEQLLELLREAYQNSPDMAWDTRMKTREGIYQHWRSIRETSTLLAIGAVYTADELAGITVWQQSDFNAHDELLFWAVRPTHQRRGLGRCLLAFSLAHWLKVPGCKQVLKTYTVTQDSGKVLQRYRQFGWQQVDNKVIGFVNPSFFLQNV